MRTTGEEPRTAGGVMDRIRMVEWVGQDDPERVDAATLRLAGDRLRALGTSRTRDYVTAWRLETGPDWVTRSMTVTVVGHGFVRRLQLIRDGDGRWSSDTDVEGGEYLSPPGIPPGVDLADALDVDLALCPATNTMPILRLGLLGGGVSETMLHMAWIDLPSLEVIRSDQLYSSAEPLPDATRRVRYESAQRDFRSELTVDADGLVIDYPQLARRRQP